MTHWAGCVLTDHMWGEGQRLIGIVWDDDNLPHHRQNPNQLAGRLIPGYLSTNKWSYFKGTDRIIESIVGS